jgi:hypothetical protein
MKSIRKLIGCVFLSFILSNLNAQWNPIAVNDYTIHELRTFNGNLFIGGNYTTINNGPCYWYSTYNDTSFSCNTVSTVGSGINQMTEYNNTLYAAGEMLNTGLNMGVASWNGTSWQSDTAFHIPGNPVNNRATAIYADGNDLYVADYLGYIHRKTGNGPYSLLSSLPFYGLHWIKSIIKYNGKIIVAGDFMGWDTTLYIWRIAQWDSGAWKPLNRGVNDAVYSMEVFNNELYVAGRFTAAFNGSNGINTNGLVKWNGSTWTDVSAGGVVNTVNDLMIYNNELYAGGSFFAAIAKWNGTGWSTLGFSNPPYGASAIGAYNNCLYIAGIPMLCNPSDTNKIIYKYCLPVGQQENMIIEKKDLDLFPNPVINFINISFNTTGNKIFAIYNCHGQKIRTFFDGYSSSERKSQFDLTELSSGIYFIEAKTEDRRIFKKFIKF